jgi:hypothetical protein
MATSPIRFNNNNMQQFSTKLLVVEHDYLPDLEVFYFEPCLYPMKYLHPRSMYTLPRGGVQGGYPLCGVRGDSEPPVEVRGQRPPKQKLPCKSIL